MKLEHRALEEIEKEILGVIGKHIDLNQYKVFFFGGRVTGHGNDRSDIDLGIEGDKPIPAKLMNNLREEMENLPILYTIDIVDFAKVSPNFYKVATRKVKYLN